MKKDDFIKEKLALTKTDRQKVKAHKQKEPLCGSLL